MTGLATGHVLRVRGDVCAMACKVGRDNTLCKQRVEVRCALVDHEQVAAVDVNESAVGVPTPDP